MAAPDFSLARPGENNTGGDFKELFLKRFAGVVMTTFEAENKFLDRHTVINIPDGKTAQFPVFGRTTAAYHTPGTMLLGQSILQSERTIGIDDLLVSHVSVAAIEEKMSHYDFWGPYAKVIGDALAKKFDQQVAQVHVLAARAAATVSGESGGGNVTDANIGTTASTLYSGVATAMQTLDEKNVPESERYLYLAPAQVALLLGLDGAVDRDFSDGGDRNKRQLGFVHGAQLIKTNNLPTANITTGPTAYRGNFVVTKGLVTHRSAVGTVKLMGVAVESDYLVTHQSTFLVGKYAMGHGILRPEAAIELRTGAP